ncbi:MAG TPA: DUF423 domain-containing protein [Bryobacteraceae bacterium]|nr:DUF423 domain-containing protein [Bryobacteraceae bacterium]
MRWSAVAAGLLGAAVVLGAFGAHSLRNRLDAYSLGVWERAVFYHFVHALGLLLIPLFRLPDAAARRIALLLLAGIFLFSGSLYVLAITGIRTLGAVTPFGGIAFIAAWGLLAFELSRAASRPE